MPVRRLNEQGWFPSVFNEFLNSDWGINANSTAPSLNIIEDDRSYKIEFAAPGMQKEDFHVNINNGNELLVSMEKQSDESCEKGKRYLRREFSYTKFRQSFIIPDNVEKEKISADISKGVLTINLPKYSSGINPKESRAIEIH